MQINTAKTQFSTFPITYKYGVSENLARYTKIHEEWQSQPPPSGHRYAGKGANNSAKTSGDEPLLQKKHIGFHPVSIDVENPSFVDHFPSFFDALAQAISIHGIIYHLVI